MGPTGLQGIQGSAGPSGAQGIQGLQGSAGPSGPQGIQGSVGPTGSQGAQGIVGPSGPRGSAGPSGAQGVQGSAGPSGAQGLTGPSGAPGIAYAYCKFFQNPRSVGIHYHMFSREIQGAERGCCGNILSASSFWPILEVDEKERQAVLLSFRLSIFTSGLFLSSGHLVYQHRQSADQLHPNVYLKWKRAMLCRL